MINRVSNSQNNVSPSFRAATLKIKKTPLGVENLKVNLNYEQECDILNTISAKVMMGKFKPVKSSNVDGVKTFKSRNGDTLTMHKNDKGFAEKFELKSKKGNEELSMQPESIDKAVTDSYTFLEEIMDSRAK